MIDTMLVDYCISNEIRKISLAGRIISIDMIFKALIHQKDELKEGDEDLLLDIRNTVVNLSNTDFNYLVKKFNTHYKFKSHSKIAFIANSPRVTAFCMLFISSVDNCEGMMRVFSANSIALNWLEQF